MKTKYLFFVLILIGGFNIISKSQTGLDTISLNIKFYSNYKDTIFFFRQLAPKNSYVFCKYGDERFMQLSGNLITYEFKSGLEDGLYIAFFDKKLKDTAMIAPIVNGEINGVLYRWDIYKKRQEIAEICEYKNGLMNGWRKLYLYDERYGWFINIEKCYDGGCETIYSEW